MDLDNLKLLKEHIDDTKKFVGKIDEDNVSFCYKKAPLIFDWKSEGYKIGNVLIDDIFNWLCYLGLGDGYIADEEVEFIDYCLELKFTKSQIHELASSKLNTDFENHIPVSLMFCCEAEIVDKKLIIADDTYPIHSENLFRLFGILGKSFIACDGEITIDEETIFNEYLNLLWQNLQDFKRRRGMDETYENLVGMNVSTKDITITTNPNKKITNKMNLVLKLLSQGYYLYDLDNIADAPINVIVKWLYRGRLGEKNFEEFYLKSSKLYPTLDIHLDYVIERISIDEIDDDLNDYSKYDDIKPKTDSRPKNDYYKLRVIELKSNFQSTEKNTRNLIQKCFPAPQMTNTKFNHLVDECSKQFFNKSESIIIMLESTQINSTHLENELKQNISILKEISSKLNSLHEELLINMSKLENNDIENILDEMERLIDSVKDYKL